MKFRDTATAYLLWCGGLLGFNGLHRFYAEKPLSGILWFVTFGFCYVGQLFDLLLIPGQVAAANTRLALMQGKPLPALPPPNRIGKKDALRIALCRTAMEHDGALTVTEGVIATGETHDQVEKALDEMARRRWVDIDNHPDTGVVIYRFLDFR